MSKVSTTRRLNVESMESRQLMAGNVFASVAGGDLNLIGDNASNGVEIRQLGPGKYHVIGLIHGGAQTKIWLGGVSANSHVVAGVTDDFNINLNGGDDYLLMSSAGLPVGAKMQVPDDLNAYMYDGLDRMILNNVQVREDAVVNLGNGHDYFYMSGSLVGGSAVEVDNDLVVLGGSGNDFAGVYSSSIRDDLFMSLGDNDDHAYILGATVGDDAWIYTGLGNDRVTMTQTRIRDELVIDTSAGRDNVLLTGVIADGIYVNTGADDDYLRVQGTQAHHARFDGSAGNFDNIDLGAGNVFALPPLIINFEL